MSVSPISTSPVRQPSPPFSLTCAPSLIPLTQSVPMRTIVDTPSPDSLAESPPLSTRIKDEPEEILEVDDHNRSSEADSGVEDIKTGIIIVYTRKKSYIFLLIEDDNSGHSDEDNGLKISNLDRKVSHCHLVFHFVC